MRNPFAAKNLPKPLPLEERFWNTVSKQPGQGPKGECWEWQGKCYKNGYGQFFATIEGKRRWLLAHRRAWIFTQGPIEVGIQVCHACDNPPCCNPAHLFLGTSHDNHVDMMQKERGNGAKGEASGKARFTEAEVRKIRELHESGIGKRKIAQMIGCAENTIHAIVHRRTWRHI